MMRFTRQGKKWRWRLVLVLLVLLTSVSLVLAAGEMMPRSVLSGGGGTVTTGALTLHSAAGQPVVGAVSGEGVLCSGFWCGPGAPEVTEGENMAYLPVVIRP